MAHGRTRRGSAVTSSTPWQAYSGARSKRYPYWVGRNHDSRLEYVPNGSGGTRKFATREAAQKVADRLQITADFDDAREHMRLAVHHMIRATDHLQPGHPIGAILSRMADIYIELTGKQL